MLWPAVPVRTCRQAQLPGRPSLLERERPRPMLSAPRAAGTRLRRAPKPLQTLNIFYCFSLGACP